MMKRLRQRIALWLAPWLVEEPTSNTFWVDTLQATHRYPSEGNIAYTATWHGGNR